ncbi:MAG: restriction endonuclease [Anaerolineae bacterium]|nr:restriction endonuclease [Anaerolineae bacterium]
MMNPLLEALRNLGGSGTIEEIDTEVIRLLGLSDDQVEILHNPERSSQTEVEYRLAWTRTYLKKYGLLENSSRGVWALTPEGRQTSQVNEREVVRFVREQDRQERAVEEDIADEPDAIATWRDQLMDALLQMDPAAFERLFQRILREAGFVQVEVTGRSGDGGIDGTGILRMGGFLSFRVLFQCKRWKGSIGSSVVRDFRGAMVGRADKGLLVTTGNFTQDAMREATRDGAPAIDLIDGVQLVDKLKEFALGVKVEPVVTEKVTIDKNWFMTL